MMQSHHRAKGASSRRVRLAALSALGLWAASSFGPAAYAVSERVEKYCKDDYLTFCGQHAVGSTGLKRCMEANGKQLSRKCVNALVDAGEVPRKYFRK